MRTSAIARIILCSLGIVILTGLLLGGLGLWTFAVDHDSMKHSIEVQSFDNQQSADGQIQSVSPTQISKIEIKWAAGNIRIEPSDQVTDIQIRETEVEDKYKMVCKVSGDTLSIRFGKDTVKFPSFGVDTVSKDLTVTIPAAWVCRELDVDAAAANVTIRDMTIGDLDFSAASGLCTLDNCQVSDLDVDAASGDLTFSGSLDTLEFEGISAGCTLVLTNCPSHIDLDGVSGQLDITLPSDCGFTVHTEGLNADFTSDFHTEHHNRGHVFGDGSCQIELDAVSGSLTIHDGGYNCQDHQSHHANHH